MVRKPRCCSFSWVAGPWLASLTTSNINEWPAVWCLFSIGLVLDRSGSMDEQVRQVNSDGTVTLTTNSIYFNATLTMGAGTQFTNAAGYLEYIRLTSTDQTRAQDQGADDIPQGDASAQKASHA